MNKIIVTGGLGYIGSHTVVKLYENGYTPVIIDNLSNSHLGVLDRIEEIIGFKPEFHQIDLCDSNALEDCFKLHNDAVGIIHFAAYKAVGESVDKPFMYYNNNIGSLLSLLEEMDKSNVDHLIFSSSCSVYGDADELPVTENTKVVKAKSPYGTTKIISEEIIEDISTHTDLRAISLRYFNPIGAHPSALIGEWPNGVPQNLVPFMTQAALGKRGELKVYGDDYNTPDGTPIRDYIYVEDLANAHVKALDYLLKRSDSSYEVFNVGTGKGNSVLELLNLFEESTGVNVPYQIVGRRLGDVVATYADVTKAKSTLNWEPQYTLKQALNSAYIWELNLSKSNL